MDLTIATSTAIGMDLTITTSTAIEMDSTIAVYSKSVLGVDSIRRGLESLPQEIYDQIYKTVFTAPTGTYCPIRRNGADSDRARAHLATITGEDYNRNDLKLFHIDHASRELYAKTYYGEGSTFMFSIKVYYPNGNSFINTPHKSWFHSIIRGHPKVLPKIIVAPQSTVEWADNPIENNWLMRAYLLEESGFGLANVAKVFFWHEGKSYGSEAPMLLLGQGGEGNEGWLSVVMNRRPELRKVLDAAFAEYQA